MHQNFQTPKEIHIYLLLVRGTLKECVGTISFSQIPKITKKVGLQIYGIAAKCIIMLMQNIQDFFFHCVEFNKFQYSFTILRLCLFGFFIPLKNFSIIRRRYHYRWRAWNVHLCSALMVTHGHNFCDMGLPFIMVISADPWHLHLLPSIWQSSCHYLFLRLMSGWDSNTQSSTSGVNAQTHCAAEKCQLKRNGLYGM